METMPLAIVTVPSPLSFTVTAAPVVAIPEVFAGTSNAATLSERTKINALKIGGRDTT